jgi:hypothetical protein
MIYKKENKNRGVKPLEKGLWVLNKLKKSGNSEH